MNKQIVDLEKELYDSKSMGLQLIEQLKLCENELSQLKLDSSKKIEELYTQCELMAKNQAVYIGKSKDQIDLGLADYIN